MGLHGHLTWITSLHPSCLTWTCTCMSLSVITCKLDRGFNEVFVKTAYCTILFNRFQLCSNFPFHTEFYGTCKPEFMVKTAPDRILLIGNAFLISVTIATIYGTTCLIHLPVLELPTS